MPMGYAPPGGEMYQSPDDLAAIAARLEAQRKAQMQADFDMGGDPTGDYGFQFGGGSNIYRDPNKDFQADLGSGLGYIDFYKKNADGSYVSPVNPSGREYLWSGVRDTPLKTVYEAQDHLGLVPQSLGGGQAIQTVGGKQYNVNGNNYAAGLDGATPRPFLATQGDARESAASVPTGFQFGNNGSLRDMQAQFSSLTPGTTSQSFVNQPQTLSPAPNPLLGTFQTPQDPAIKALLQSRRQK